jgi:REP element-mobilizing transposase RayT
LERRGNHPSHDRPYLRDIGRPHRHQQRGTLYHLTARGVGRGDIFIDDSDRSAFLAVIARAGERAGWSCQAYCLMSNHYHLLVESGPGGLSQPMHAINAALARRFNDREERWGHLFGARFHSRPVVDPPHHPEVVRYIVLNPVAAGICRRPAAWPWSSYRATAGLEEPHPCLDTRRALDAFGGDRATFCRYVSDRLDLSSLERILRPGTESALVLANRVLGYSQSEIATVLGVSQTSVGRRLRAAGD